MQRSYATRSSNASYQGDWALAGPSVGPGFVSTAFRLDRFQAEAKKCWLELNDALRGVPEVARPDLNPADLRLPSLQEQVKLIVESKLNEEKVNSKAGNSNRQQIFALEIRAEQAKLSTTGESDIDAGKGKENEPDENQRRSKRVKIASLQGAALDESAGQVPNNPTSASRGRESSPEDEGINGGKQGTKHWKPSGDLPDLPEDAKIAAIPHRGGRYKQDGYKKNAKKKTLPQYGGQGNDLEQERRKHYEDSAKDLKSVSVALENPILHCTAFYARPEGPGNTAAEGNDTGDDNGKQLLSKDEIILRIAIREYDALHVTHQEFLVPGCQKLSELRDAISCPADRNMQSLKMAVQGAFMYIEGIFYTDRRGQGRVVDYVSPIKAFCDEHFISAPSPPGDEAEAMPVKKRHVQGEPEGEEDGSSPVDYKQLDMTRVCWNEIGLRAGPGARNVYCHQACCEHLLVVKDVRRIHPDDPPHLESYPKVISHENFFRRVCDICDESMARKVTYDDKNAPQEPAFWCMTCYKMMHYDSSNNLLYRHKVFDYQGG